MAAWPRGTWRERGSGGGHGRIGIRGSGTWKVAEILLYYQHAGRHGAPSGQAGTYPLASDVLCVC
eukprot:4782574-Prymnesium_polylepis.1